MSLRLIQRRFDKRFRKAQRAATLAGIRAGRAQRSYQTSPYQPTFVKAKYTPSWNKGYHKAVRSAQRVAAARKAGWWKEYLHPRGQGGKFRAK